MSSQVSGSDPGTAVADGGGAAAAPASAPPPATDGQRVRLPGSTNVWLVDRGLRRLIPDNQTYANLFRDRNGERSDLPEPALPPLGPPLDSGALLIRSTTTSDTRIFLLDEHKKRFIATNEALEKYHFIAPQQAVRVPTIVLEYISDGPTIT